MPQTNVTQSKAFLINKTALIMGMKMDIVCGMCSVKKRPFFSSSNYKSHN